MKEFTQIGNHPVEIWRRPRQKHMHLRVRPDRSLRVTCNRRASKREVIDFVRECEPFIAQRLAEIDAFTARFPPKKFISDETHLCFGERLPLRIVWSWNPRIKVQTRPDHFEMIAPLSSRPAERQKALHRHLRALAGEVLRDRVAKHAAVMNLHPASVTIRGQRTRWGSCSSDGHLNLNWKLLAAPPEVIDYVVVHELAHLRHMDHSPRFWALVETHYPNAGAAKKWLRANEAEINFQFQKLSPG